MPSIIIPAYNEGQVIERCLDAVLADAKPGEFEIVVVCNGCKDDTAERARRYGDRVTVVETPVGSKIGALNLGDDHATRFPRFYVDADIQLTAHAMTRHGGADPLQLLQGVAQRQARLIAQWMNLGFIHGVMNTDNMTISGESIDFGPCAFMEAYEPATVFSSIDQQGRYAYRNQPLIAFALLMLVVGGVMLLRRSAGEQAGVARSWPVIAATGVGVGVLTGFLGVGGGFLIVPALVMLVGLPMRQAVGTSLIIIAMNSLAGFLGHLGGPPTDFGIVAVFAAAGIAGALLGARLARRLNATMLRTAFAVFVIGLAVVLLVDNVRYLV